MLREDGQRKHTGTRRTGLEGWIGRPLSKDNHLPTPLSAPYPESEGQWQANDGDGKDLPVWRPLPC